MQIIVSMKKIIEFWSILKNVLSLFSGIQFFCTRNYSNLHLSLLVDLVLAYIAQCFTTDFHLILQSGSQKSLIDFTMDHLLNCSNKLLTAKNCEICGDLLPVSRHSNQAAHSCQQETEADDGKVCSLSLLIMTGWLPRQ